jgi:hypothetical protein
MKRNYFIVDYSSWELLVSLADVRYKIDLRQGLVGDCWSEITNPSGDKLEINFYQENKYELPIVGVHGMYDADTRYCISVEYFGCLGNKDDYFGEVVLDDRLNRVKRLLMDKYLLKHNRAERVVREYADVIIQGLFDGKSEEEIIREVEL